MKHAALLSLAALTLASCAMTRTPAAPAGQVAYGLGSNTLYTFGLDNPQASLRSLTINGLGNGETLVDLDVRNTDGQLYGVTSSGKVYRIDATTGWTTDDSSVTLNGTSVVAVDFNPAANRLRVLGTGDFNARHTLAGAPVPATTGTTADGTFAYAPTDVNAGKNPNLVAAAYTNSFNDTGKANSGQSTTLYSVDADLDALITHPAAGGPTFNTLQTVGALGVNVTPGRTGLDIAGANLAVLSSAGATNTTLYTVNLTSGQATQKGTVNVALSSVALKLMTP
ncbi:DUF4394 domain-containing protein [Deinococcus radiotolerans]|uniref:DUF4394 domain-containing protein n=1 Tax=Deinococcus radiotolerans TaxID=1309407 RepID=A0ABQ2FH94_9DEIO|nr:DUF4394 domain-containing protein [Deinococcus radiotolerans]GGK94908.1 hypothetical protein GCM10010844_11810 [Deinococcus radiotolerans]